MSGLTDNNLWFVNPWITAGNSKGILDSVDNGYTTLYMYVIVVNTGNTAYSPTAGTIDLTWFASNHIREFWRRRQGHIHSFFFFYTAEYPRRRGLLRNIQDRQFNIYAKLTRRPIRSCSGGGAAITNVGTLGELVAEDENFYSGVILSSGLWIRYEPLSTSPCAV